MRIVLATIGTRGDVQPMLALAQALVRRGHQPIVACPVSFAPWVQSLGFEHRELGEDMQAVMKKQERSMRAITQYFKEQMLQQFAQLIEIARDSDAIVATGIAHASPSVAQKLSIPALMLIGSTAALPSPQHAPPIVPWQGLPRWLNSLLWRMNSSVLERMMGAAVNEGRARLELPPLDGFAKHLFIDTPLVVAADEQLMPPDPAWQGRYQYAGFLSFDDPTPLDPALDAWLSAGEAPVYVGFGSMIGSETDRVAAALRDAVRATGLRCLVAAGWAGFGQGELPDGFFAVREAPHQLLFPRVAAVVHHGGSGTMASALRAGVPQVLLPMLLDQFHHAHLLPRLGLAAQAPVMKKVTAQSLGAAITRAIALPAAPRRAIAARLARSDAGGVIVGMLERMRTRGDAGNTATCAAVVD